MSGPQNSEREKEEELRVCPLSFSLVCAHTREREREDEVLLMTASLDGAFVIKCTSSAVSFSASASSALTCGATCEFAFWEESSRTERCKEK